MIPSLDDRFASMIRAVEQVILPALQGQHGLAEEQMHLVLGHLHQLKAQVDLVPAYELAERGGLAGLAHDLAAAADGGPATLAAARRLGEAAAHREDDGATGRRAAVQQLGDAINALIVAAHQDGSAAFRRDLYRLVIGHGALSADRDRSWFQASGFEGPGADLRPIHDYLG